ncbi:hypothetical protein C8Q75DRAFT_509627 [Abortiporus biennis]|nr:hypothetical protein C8Q75DRAFT_509627 [Abortiporus biennis]
MARKCSPKNHSHSNTVNNLNPLYTTSEIPEQFQQAMNVNPTFVLPDRRVGNHYHCPICDVLISKERGYVRHNESTEHAGNASDKSFVPRYQCERCKKRFTRDCSRVRHQANIRACDRFLNRNRRKDTRARKPSSSSALTPSQSPSTSSASSPASTSSSTSSSSSAFSTSSSAFSSSSFASPSSSSSSASPFQSASSSSSLRSISSSNSPSYTPTTFSGVLNSQSLSPHTTENSHVTNVSSIPSSAGTVTPNVPFYPPAIQQSGYMERVSYTPPIRMENYSSYPLGLSVPPTTGTRLLPFVGNHQNENDPSTYLPNGSLYSLPPNLNHPPGYFQPEDTEFPLASTATQTYASNITSGYTLLPQSSAFPRSSPSVQYRMGETIPLPYWMTTSDTLYSLPPNHRQERTHPVDASSSPPPFTQTSSTYITPNNIPFTDISSSPSVHYHERENIPPQQWTTTSDVRYSLSCENSQGYAQPINAPSSTQALSPSTTLNYSPIEISMGFYNPSNPMDFLLDMWQHLDTDKTWS